ncbi:putative reverse transcriptase domain-containing protein [Tanacetum coccineum]
MDFITKLPRTRSRHDAIWVVVDRLTKSAHFLAIRKDYSTEKLARLYTDEIVARHGVPVSPVLWAEIGEGSLIRPELVHVLTDKVVVIKEKLQAARDRQKSYADSGRKMTKYGVGENVLLKVSPWKAVMHFGKKGKLAPRYVGPFEILERIVPVAYQLRLPEELIDVHDTFHEPVEIMDREVKSLKRSRIPLVKVRWNSKRIKSRDEISIRRRYYDNRDLSRYMISFEVYDHLILSAFMFGDEYSICSLVVIMERNGVLHAMLRQ